jgi:hypothetical protein
MQTSFVVLPLGAWWLGFLPVNTAVLAPVLRVRLIGRLLARAVDSLWITLFDSVRLRFSVSDLVLAAAKVYYPVFSERRSASTTPVVVFSASLPSCDCR